MTDIQTRLTPRPAARPHDEPAGGWRSPSAPPATDPVVAFCRAMHMRALDRATAQFAETRNPVTMGVCVQMTASGALVCTVTRRERDGLYQPRWTLQGVPCSRLEAEDVIARQFDTRIGGAA